MIVQTQDFKGDLAAMLQRHFYRKESYKMALFAPKDEVDAAPPVDVDGSPMQWIDPVSGSRMHEGDILPSGLALSRSRVKKLEGSSTYYLDPRGESTGASLVLEPEFLARWDVILSAFLFEDPEKLAQESGRIIMQGIDQREEPHDSSSERKVLFIPLIEELEPKLVSDWEKLFWEGESILHLELAKESQILDDGKSKHWMNEPISWRFILLATVLSGLYGGVHLIIWGQFFPSYVEEVMWKVSCLIIICCFPCFVTFIMLSLFLTDPLESLMTNLDDIFDALAVLSFYSVAFVYFTARVFIIVESFLSLRQSPVGVFLSPEWVELFPHI